jgi:hypothetical protein
MALLLGLSGCPDTSDNSASPTSPSYNSSSFSNAADEEKGAIDLITANADEESLFISLSPGEEEVKLGEGDIPTGGLTLTTANSPANVVIDGGGRTVDLIGSTKGSLITVGSGVTLTLLNITFKGLCGTGGEGKNNSSLFLIRATDRAAKNSSLKAARLFRTTYRVAVIAAAGYMLPASSS